MAEAEAGEGGRGGALEVLAAFSGLGVRAFGGPIAHLGYFHEAFVRRRRWLDEAAYAEIVALCQLLPGPTSSQVGFALGLRRAGPWGAAAAWAGFTLPSAVLMVAFAYASASLQGRWGQGLVHGLQLAAVAVVAQAAFALARKLAPDLQRAAILAAAAAIALLAPPQTGQLLPIAGGALAGLLLRPPAAEPLSPPPSSTVSRRTGLVAAAAFFGLFVGAPLLAALTGWPAAARFAAVSGAGALVFGGGHVVLPLLHEAVVTPGWVDADRFVAGYGAVQAAPGPLFSFAAYLGAVMHGSPTGLPGAGLALAAIFAPGLLALLAAWPFWDALRRARRARAALRGVEAAVAGLLVAALYDPVWTGAVHDPLDAAAAVAGAALLATGRVPPLAVVAAGAALGIVRAL